MIKIAKNIKVHNISEIKCNLRNFEVSCFIEKMNNFKNSLFCQSPGYHRFRGNQSISAQYKAFDKVKLQILTCKKVKLATSGLVSQQNYSKFCVMDLVQRKAGGCQLMIK